MDSSKLSDFLSNCIILMLDLVHKQVICILMCTNCAHLDLLISFNTAKNTSVVA